MKKFLEKTLADNLSGLNAIISIIKESREKDELLSKLTGTIISDNSFKSLVKITLDNSSYYVKVYWDTNMFSVLKNVYRGDLRAFREAEGLLLLQKHGFNTPRLISYGVVDYSFIQKHSYIITKEVEGYRSVDECLSKRYDESIMVAVGKLIGSIHKHDMVYGDFHSENVLISNNDEEDFIFLDWMGVKKTDNLQKKLVDLAKFIYYSGDKNWQGKEQLIEHFVKSYWNYFNETHEEHLEYEELTHMIDQKLKSLTRVFAFYKMLVHIG